MSIQNSNKISRQELEQLERTLHNEIEHAKPAWQPASSFDTIWTKYQQSKSSKGRLPGKQWIYKKRYITVLSTLILSVGFLLTLVLLPSIGEALREISFVKSLSQGGFARPGYERIQQKQLADSTPYSITDQGITLTVKKVFYDGINILIGYEVVDTERRKRIQGSNPGPWLDYDFHGVHTNGVMIEPRHTLIDPDHLEGVAVISFIADNLPDTMPVTISSQRITDTRGQWSLTIPISQQKSKRYTHTIYPDTAVTVNGHALHVSKLILGPVSNQITLTGESLSIYWEPTVKVVDDKGKILTAAGNAGGPGERILGFEPFSDSNPRPKYIKMVFDDQRKMALSEASGASDTSTSTKTVTIKIPLHWNATNDNNPKKDKDNP